LSPTDWLRWQDPREHAFRAQKQGEACTLALAVGGPVTIVATGKRLVRCAANGDVKELGS
jgi:hypothetical protein